MRKRGAAARMALCGVLAALAVALMFLGKSEAKRS